MIKGLKDCHEKSNNPLIRKIRVKTMENNLPKGWIEISFTELLDVQGGTQPPKSTFIYVPKKDYIRLLQIRDFGEKPHPTFIPFRTQLKTCTKEDILIARYGASLGRIVTGMEGAYNVALAKVIIPDEINKKFVYHLLKSEIFQRPILANERSAQDGFNKDDLERIQIPLPPLPEQQRIVEKLDALMARISNSKTRLEKIPTLLKNFRQSVLAAAVSGELTKEWRVKNDVESADNLLMRYEDYRRTVYNEALKNAKKSNSSKPTLPRALKEDFYFEITEIDELPNSWQWTVIDKIGVVALGGTPSRKIAEYWKGDVNWVSSGEVSNNRISDTIEKITQEGLENSNAKIYPKGTVLLAMIGEGKTRGQSSILDAPSSTNQNVAAIILNNDFFHSEYVWYYLQSIYERIRKDGSGGAQQALNGFLVGQLNIAIPPLEEQKEIVRKVEELFHFADSIEARYQKAKAWFDKLPQALLAKAFRGELVPQNESDEPASELLKRIQEEKHTITKTPKHAALKTKAKKYRIDEDEELRMVAEG